MDIVQGQVEEYLRKLASSDDEPVLLEMERLATERGFPIIDRLCGRLLELLALCVGARRVFELGSGFGRLDGVGRREPDHRRHGDHKQRYARWPHSAVTILGATEVRT